MAKACVSLQEITIPQRTEQTDARGAGGVIQLTLLDSTAKRVPSIAIVDGPMICSCALASDPAGADMSGTGVISRPINRQIRSLGGQRPAADSEPR